MSYEIVKKVQANNGKLRFFWASNNVSPRTYEWSREYTPTEVAEAITGRSIQFTSKSKLAKQIEALADQFSWQKVYDKYPDFTSDQHIHARRNQNAMFVANMNVILKETK